MNYTTFKVYALKLMRCYLVDFHKFCEIFHQETPQTSISFNTDVICLTRQFIYIFSDNL